jgi:hypothetical protein
MNHQQYEMLECLKRGKQEFGVVAVKAEFEAEGTRLDELLRLLDLAYQASLPVMLKIGGCESLRDLREAKQLGIHHIIAPLVETPYALQKYIGAKNQVFSAQEQHHIQFFFNLESITGYHHRSDLLYLAAADSAIQGVVFGRLDFAASLGKGREAVEEEMVTTAAMDVAQLCQDHQLDFTVGGGMSVASIEALQRIKTIKLDRFQTRKIVFSSAALQGENLQQGILEAIEFELLWLTDKQGYYAHIQQEDQARIQRLAQQLRVFKKN